MFVDIIFLEFTRIEICFILMWYNIFHVFNYFQDTSSVDAYYFKQFIEDVQHNNPHKIRRNQFMLLGPPTGGQGGPINSAPSLCPYARMLRDFSQNCSIRYEVRGH